MLDLLHMVVPIVSNKAKPRRLKTLFLIDGLLVGGAEKSLLEIVRNFESTDVVFCHIYPDAPLKPVFEAAGIRVISLDVPGKYSFLIALRKVSEVVRRECPDVLHTTLYRAGIVGRLVALITRIPIVDSFVSESYGPVRYKGLGRLARLKRNGLKWLDRLTAPKVNLFIANSAHIATSNARYLNVPVEKVVVIPRGRAPQDYTQADSLASKKFRDFCNIPVEAKVLLCVGRFWPGKCQNDILCAMPSIRAVFPFTWLVFAGDGPECGYMRELAKSLGLDAQVVFLGMRHDIPALLQMADVFISASEYEGLPGSVIEAMLADLPVVLSRIPVHQEMIRDGETGLFFTLHNSDDLARQVVQLLNDPALRQRLAGAALAEAREKYDIRKVAAQYEEVYRELLDA